MLDDPNRAVSASDGARDGSREIAPSANQGINWPRARDIPISILAWSLVLFIAFWAAGHIIGTLLVLAIAVLIAYALTPLVAVLRRWIPWPFAILIVYLIFIGLLGLLFFVIIDTAVSQALPLVTRIQKFLTPGVNGGNSPLVDFLANFGITSEQLTAFINQLFDRLTGIASNLVPVVTGVLGGVVNVIVTLIISVYFVANAPRVGMWLRTGMPMRVRPRAVLILDTINHVIGGYIRGQVTLSTLVGVLVGASMAALQIPYAILLGVMAFTLEFIPFLGVLISGAACVLVALTQGVVKALIVLAVFVVIHVIEGDVVGPRIVGSAVGLHPVISIIALIAGAEVFGLWGALFASPVAGVLQSLAIEFWREWKRAHPDQFPTGSTVTADVAVVPVQTEQEAETPGERPPGYGAPPDDAAGLSPGDASDEPDADPSATASKS
jgi:predicted PurR-regulated permease PerM